MSLGSDTSQVSDSHPHLGNLVFAKGMLKLCRKLDCSVKLYEGDFFVRDFKKLKCEINFQMTNGFFTESEAVHCRDNDR